MSTLSRRQFVGRGAGALGTAICLSRTVDSIASEPNNPNGGPPQATPNVNDLVEQTHAFIVSLNAPELAHFLAEWPRPPENT
jgi:hypothetical protein